MAIRNILRETDKTLLKKSRVVTDFNERLHVLLDDMRETLAEANGVGLAAPQVGVLRRAVLVVDTETEDGEDRVLELINPEITASSGEQTGPEGCLSVPGVCGIVTRPELVKVRAQDRSGNEFEIWGKGLTARAFCHEIDHLNGIIFTSLAERIMTDEEMEEMYSAENEGDEAECE